MSWSSAKQRALRVLVLIATLVGCAQEQQKPTAIVLYVDGDIQGFRRAVYRVSAAGEDGGEATSEPEGPGAAILPQTFVITKGQAERVLVAVTALDEAGRAIVTQRAYVTFRRNETISARITLAQACVELDCASDESCSVGAPFAATCEPIAEAPTKSVDKPGDERSWDAGIVGAPDGGDGVREAGSLRDDAQAAPAVDAEVDDDASVEPIDAAPRCERSRGECDVVSGCGCEGKPGMHCQAREGAGPVCARYGEVPRNHHCKGNEECGPGLACVGLVCRTYCKDAADCDGDCVPTSSTIVEKVCIERCALGAKCGGTGVECVQRKGDVSEGRCLFKREPCPTNRTCEEPVIGDGTCARGTDAQDCCPGRKGNCDLLDSCGCREGLVCQLPQADTSADAQCGMAGPRPRGATCSGQAECAKGLGCIAGICAEYCRPDTTCAARGVCTTLSSLGVAFCRYPCNVRTQGAGECAPGTVCKGPADDAYCTVQL